MKNQVALPIALSVCLFTQAWCVSFPHNDWLLAGVVLASIGLAIGVARVIPGQGSVPNTFDWRVRFFLWAMAPTALLMLCSVASDFAEVVLLLSAFASVSLIAFAIQARPLGSDGNSVASEVGNE